AHTQLEHIRMPANAQWSWLEAYGHVQADPKAVHEGSWADARSAVGEQVERTLPREELERRYREAGKTSLLPVAEVLHRGSGWGALEAAGIAPNGEHAMEPIEDAVAAVYAELVANGGLSASAPAPALSA
ncbi:MAG: hypothetical protein ACOCWF_04385, partial [Halochromatium sp.]